MNRNNEIDALKSFLIWSVIFVHLMLAIPCTESTRILYPAQAALINYYFMPLFICIAGYFFRLTVKKAPFYVIITNKFTELITPIILWFGAYGLCQNINTINTNNVFQILYDECYGKLWFLSATFASLVLIAVARLLCSSNLKRFLILTLLITIGLHFIHAPNSLIFKWNHHLPYMFPFAVIGYVTAEVNICDFFSSKKVWLSVSFIYFLLCCFAPEKVNPWEIGTDLFNPDFSWQYIAYCSTYRNVLACAGIIFILPILRYIWHKLPSCQVIILAGRNTLAIYVLQSFFVERFLKSLHIGNTTFYHSYPSIIHAVLCPLAAVIITIALTYIAILLKKTPVIGKYLFGFKLIPYKAKH